VNNLARLNEVKADEAGVDGTTALDTILTRSIAEVSREFEASTRRSFVARSGTRYLGRHPRACPSELRFEEDLASITSVLVDDNGDDTYEITLVETTDYFVEREDDLDTNTPITCLRLNPNGTQLTRWPTYLRGVKITGLWGYSYELENTTLTASAISSTTATSVTVSATAASLIFPGDTLVIDSEQMEVTAVVTTTLTVVRGINGTTAATHSAAAATYIRRYPRDVERAVAERVVGLRWDVQGGYAAGVTMPDGGNPNKGAYARWKATVHRYKNWAVA